MFDDDDDAEPQFNVVDNYDFEDDMKEPVCFSILPLKFDENDEVACLDSKMDLHGCADNGLHTVHKKVVAWSVGFDYEQPKISVLSSEGNWIELLKPRKCYEKTVRSILITVQMLHYVRKWPRKRKRSLLDHLCEVFNKFDNKPTEYDLKRHYSIIKLFAETDPTLMKSKVLQSFIERTSGKIKKPILKGTGSKEPTVANSSNDEDDFDNDNDGDYDDKDDSRDDDYSCKDDDSDSDDNGDGKDDNSNDGYISNNDDNDDGDIDNDDGGGTDQLCAICDNGGRLLSCVGRCRRAFHPREKDGRESNCETLGFTSAKLQEIDQYLCKNCEYKQHQCFKCGELESSYGPNAKVFQCYKASCGHFYHPSCVAKLLEPHDTDGACVLEKRIAAGMSFTCPTHWCSECGKMEDSTQLALWLAVCRRCPVTYHKKCLPSKISFKKKRGTSTRAWHLDDRIIIYCENHEMDDTIGTPSRDHIKLPLITEIDVTRDLAKKNANVTGKRKKNTEQGSTESAELLKKLYREGDQTQRVATNYSTEHIVLKERGVPKKDTIHANQVPNDELDNLITEEWAEGGENNFKSGKERERHMGENVCGHDLISGQEKEISRRENRMGGSTYEPDSRSGKEKVPWNEGNKVCLPDGFFTQDHVDCLPPKKQLQVACVEKATATNRSDTQQECGCDSDQEVEESYASQNELKSTQCIGNPKATEIDTSGNKSRKREEHKERATDCKMLVLDRNRKHAHMKNGRDACCEDESPQHLDNHKEPDVLAYNFRNHDLNSPRYFPSKSSYRRNDDWIAAKTSEYKSREGRGSDESKKWRNHTRVNSYGGNSHMGRRNPQKRSRDYSPEGRRMDYRSSYPRSNNRHRYEQRGVTDYSSDGYAGRRRRSCRDDYSSDGDVGRRLSPQQPAFSPTNVGTMHSSPSYPTRAEYCTSEGHGSPSYLRRSEHVTSRRHGPCLHPRGPEHEDYAMDWRAVPVLRDPPDGEYDEYANLNYGGYHAVDIRRVGMHSFRENCTGAYGPQTDASMDQLYGGRIINYGVRSDYPQQNRLNQENRALAAGSVTERYAPRLERTNLYR